MVSITCMKKNKAFTLVEVLIASVVLSLFLTGAYSLFFGGQRVAGKAAWLQYTIEHLRFTQQAIFKAIKTSSYPSTLLPSNIYDAGGTTVSPGIYAANYFIRIAGIGKIAAKDIISNNNGVFLVTCAAEPEIKNFSDVSKNKSGKIRWSIFYMKKSQNSDSTGVIYMETRDKTYTSNPPDYAASLNLDYKTAKKSGVFKLSDDIEWIDVVVSNPGYKPSLINIVLSAKYYRAQSLTRQSKIKVLPNVGVITTLN